LFATLVAAGPLDGLTPEEKALADSVDDWGLAFGDQLSRFRDHFTAQTNAAYAVGVTHDLVKILPNKYWFRGRVFLPDTATNLAPQLQGCPGETLSFQLAVLSAPGNSGGMFRVQAQCPGAATRPEIHLFREVFLKCPVPPYPRAASERWPDPLVEEAEAAAGPVEPAVFWVDIAIPTNATDRTYDCSFEVARSGGAARVSFRAPIRVIPGLVLDPKEYPLVASFSRRHGTNQLAEVQIRNMCAMLLKHHCQPLGLCAWDSKAPEVFDDMVRFLLDRGQRVIDIGSPPPENAKAELQQSYQALYSHLRQQDWLKMAMAYSNADEPDQETFRTHNVPYLRYVRRAYPGLRIYLASELHPDIADGCDIALTDLSSSLYDPRNFQAAGKPELWHYYCHLPVNWQMRAPLVQAPNMQLDNPALDHRVAGWMSYRFGAKGIYIWAGNLEWDKMTTIWQDGAIQTKATYTYPYGGVHNGNGNLVYPPRDQGGPVIPSIRLKVLRNGLQDIALLNACERVCAGKGPVKVSAARRKELRGLIDPVPGVFQHPHYYDRLPETLLERRAAILRLLN
jgi:hypothetical protein